MGNLTRDMNSAIMQRRVRSAAKDMSGKPEISRKSVPRGREQFFAKVASRPDYGIGGKAAGQFTARYIERAMKRLGSMRRAQDRSPANKLARSILKRGVNPTGLRDKLAKSSMDSMGYMGYGKGDPAKAASRAARAATVQKAIRIANRAANSSPKIQQMVLGNFEKNRPFFGPGGQRIKGK